MQQTSRLILGCRKCKDSYEINGGFITMPQHLMFLTAHYQSDLEHLFHENFSCPICQNQLYITPMFIDFIMEFNQKPYHIEFEEYYIRLANENFNIAFPHNQAPEKVASELFQNPRYQPYHHQLPSMNMIHTLQDLATEYNRVHWIVRLESSSVQESYESLINNPK